MIHTLRWLHADIRSLRAAVKDCFEAVITCGSSLLHLVSPRDLSEALESGLVNSGVRTQNRLSVSDREVKRESDCLGDGRHLLPG